MIALHEYYTNRSVLYQVIDGLRDRDHFEEFDQCTADFLTLLWDSYFETGHSTIYTSKTSDWNLLHEVYVYPIHLPFWQLPLAERLADAQHWRQYLSATRKALNHFIVGIRVDIRHDLIQLLRAYETAFTTRFVQKNQ